MILAEEMRPTRLSQVLGQKSVIEAMRKQMATRPPQAIMFSGGTGCGKTTLAEIVAISLQCTHQTQWGEPCDACTANRSHFAIHDINASDANGVEDIRRFVDLARYQPTSGLRKVLILDEAQKITSAAQNVLLKPFEPRKDTTTTWIICTTEPVKILPTLRRRCLHYQLRSLGFKGVELLLARGAKRSKFTGSLEALTEKIHEAKVTSPALVLMALEKFVSGMSVEEAVADAETGVSTLNSLAICKELTRGNWTGVRDQIKTMVPEDARFVRASALGYLRGWLMRENNSANATRVTNAMRELTANPPFEESLLVHWVIVALFRATQHFRGAR